MVTDEEKKARVLAAFRKALADLEQAPPGIRSHMQGGAMGLISALQLCELVDDAEYAALEAEIG